jgi:hypothetical protein
LLIADRRLPIFDCIADLDLIADWPIADLPDCRSRIVDLPDCRLRIVD